MFAVPQGLCRAVTLQMRYLWRCRLQTDILQRSLHIQSINVNRGYNSLYSDNISLLAPTNLQYTQICGLKHVGNVHRRCKDCHLMLKEGVMYNYCKTHPRHNQKARTKRPKNTWILTAVTTTKVRPWWRINVTNRNVFFIGIVRKKRIENKLVHIYLVSQN